ncbi:hypothetical protein AB0D10_00700 [Kitasatospora sp. NPDC048545]|uniref:hypothetical protein n=1 Tax=Kitasatospora sp. NPDC048545 TaxID=3157208 RepID=UPI0033C89919
MTSHVRAGQVYEACHPGDGQRRIRVLSVTGNRASVETLGLGPARRRDMLLTALHASATTATGRLRRAGYRLLDPRGTEPHVNDQAAAPSRPNASNITDPELDLLWERAEDAETRLACAAQLLASGYSDLHTRVDIARRLCAGDITTAQARDDDRGE